MKSFRARNSARHHFHGHITHSMYNKHSHRKSYPNGYFDNCHDGLIQDISQGGMRFKSTVPCRIGSKIFVNMLGDVQGLHLTKRSEPYTGKVTWCERNSRNADTEYYVGVRFD